MNKSSLVQVVLCLMVALLTSCSASTYSRGTATPRPIIKITSFPANLKIDDIDIEFSGYKRDSEFLSLEICFAPPSKAKWIFDDFLFKIENQEIPPMWLISNSETGRADGFSCGILSYPIDLIPDSGSAELTIGQLQTDVSNDNPDCDKAQKNLDAAETGIVVTCDLSALGIESGFGILKKPQGITEQEAYNRAKDAFSDTIQIDWRFSFTFERP